MIIDYYYQKKKPIYFFPGDEYSCQLITLSEAITTRRGIFTTNAIEYWNTLFSRLPSLLVVASK